MLLARGAVVVLALLLVAAVVLGLRATQSEREAVAQRIEAELQRDEAERQANIALTRALAAQAPLQHGFGEDERGALLARQAFLFNRQSGNAVPDQVDKALRDVLGIDNFSTILRRPSVWAVAFSPNGKTLALGNFDGTVQLLRMDRPSSQPIALSGHKGSVTSMSFSPDGKTLASGSYDGTVRLWDPDRTEAEPFVLTSGNAVQSVAFSPDGLRLAAGALDGTLRVWQPSRPDAAPIQFTGFAHSTRNAFFSRDGKMLIAVGCAVANTDGGTCGQGEVRRWDLGAASAAPTVLATHDGMLTSAALSPDGRVLATGADDGTLQLWDPDQPDAAPVALAGHQAPVEALAFSHDGRTLASAGIFDGTVRVWDLSDPTGEPTVLDHYAEPFAVAFSPDDHVLASGAADGMRLWRLNGTMAAVRLLDDEQSHLVSFSPDGEILATTARLDGKPHVQLWNPDSPDSPPTSMTSPDEGFVRGLAFSPDGQTLATAGSGGMIQLWTPSQPDLAPVDLSGPGLEIWSVAFGPAGEHVAAVGCREEDPNRGCERGEAWVWSYQKSSQPSLAFPAFNVNRSAIAIGPDDRKVAVAGCETPEADGECRGGEVRVFDLSSPEARPIVGQLSGPAYAVAFSPDGTSLAVGGCARPVAGFSCTEDGAVWLWDQTAPDAVPLLLTGHQSAVFAVAFSLDGRTLATGSADGTIRLWDLSRPTVRPVTLSTDAVVRSLAFSPDGLVLASGGDGFVRLWNPNTESLSEDVCAIVLRNLTEDEWHQFVGAEVPYEPTCPNLPPGGGIATPVAADA
jgi:WD40 repeat protein